MQFSRISKARGKQLLTNIPVKIREEYNIDPKTSYIVWYDRDGFLTGSIIENDFDVLQLLEKDRQ